MSDLFTLFDTSWLQAIGWTILHSIWVISLVGALLKISLTSTRLQQSARWRYILSVSTLLSVTLIVCTLFWNLKNDIEAASPAELTLTTNSEVLAFDTISPSTASQITKVTPVKIYSLRQRIESSFPLLILIWGAGVLILSLRFLGGLWVLYHLKRKGLTAMEPAWLEKMRSFQQQMHISRKVALYYSDRVHQPITVGFFKPLILMPVGLLNQLTTAEVELVLLHELAHIRRADYLVNLLQSLVEILFFYHPVVWWISQQIRESREHCCDDLAIQISKDPKAYALALTRLQKLILLPKIPLTMNISGNNFTHRIQRLFGISQPETSSFWLPSLLFITLSVTGYQAIFAEKENIHDDSLADKVWVFNNENTIKDLLPMQTFLQAKGYEFEFVYLDTTSLGYLKEARGLIRKGNFCKAEFMFNVEDYPMEIRVNEKFGCGNFNMIKLGDVSNLSSKAGEEKVSKIQWGTFEWKTGEKPTFLPLQLSFLAKLPMKIIAGENEYRVQKINSIVWVPRKQDPVEYLKCDYMDSERIATIIQKGRPGDHYYFEGVHAGSLAPINIVFKVEEPMEDFEGAGLSFLSNKDMEVKERDGLQIIITDEIKMNRVKNNGQPVPLMYINGEKIRLPRSPSGIPTQFEDDYQAIDSLIQMGPKKAKELLGLDHPTGAILLFKKEEKRNQELSKFPSLCSDIKFRWGSMEFNGINSILRLKEDELDQLRSNPIQVFACGKQQQILSIGNMSLVTKGDDPASISIDDYKEVANQKHTYHKMLKRLMTDDILYISDLKVSGGRFYNFKIVVESDDDVIDNQEPIGMCIRVDGHIEYNEDTEIMKLFGTWTEIERSSKPIHELPLFYLNGERLIANPNVNNIPEALLGKVRIDSVIVYNEKLVKESLGIDHEPGAWFFYSSGQSSTFPSKTKDTTEIIALSRPQASMKVTEEPEKGPKSSITVYPNPAVDQAIIELDLKESTIVKIRVVDLQGKVVQDFGEKPFEQGLHKINWDMQTHPAGIYFVEIQIDDQPFTSMKVVKK